MRRENIWELQKNPDGDKGSLRKTCESQTEAREKVWDLNKETENGLETLAVLFERFERANSDLADIDKQFDVRYEEMEELVEGEGNWRLRSGDFCVSRKWHPLYLSSDGS